ncbi:MAG: hypothetical protein DMF60_08910 [Acidobacteria bacterium]|nr:MAG: hypothetical protein DMF60_08910 [Acidobacteriota bacterium]
MSSVKSVERRDRNERRRQERRRSIRYTAETLIVIGGVTWIDNEGTDRRRKVRRKDDRERLARNILEDSMLSEQTS